MKYIKKFESEDKILEDFSEKAKNDITYLAKKIDLPLSYGIKHVIDSIIYYKMTDEQIYNLRLAVEYRYLNIKDYRHTVSNIIHYDNMSRSEYFAEIKFKESFEKNFKDKIIKIKKPYSICIE